MCGNHAEEGGRLLRHCPIGTGSGGEWRSNRQEEIRQWWADGEEAIRASAHLVAAREHVSSAAPEHVVRGE
jgi:hypothetical protein